MYSQFHVAPTQHNGLRTPPPAPKHTTHLTLLVLHRHNKQQKLTMGAHSNINTRAHSREKLLIALSPPSVRSHPSTQLPLGGFTSNLIPWNCIKICPEKGSNLVKKTKNLKIKKSGTSHEELSRCGRLQRHRCATNTLLCNNENFYIVDNEM